MDKDLMQQLVAWIQSTSPTLWHIAVKQVQTQMIQNVYGIVVGLIFAGGLLWLGIYCCRKVNEMEDKHGDGEGFYFWAIMCLVTCATIVGAILISTVPYLIQVWTNPDYAALQAIITLAAKVK